MTGLLVGQNFDSVLIGDESLMRRPMNRVAQPLGSMGAAIDTQNGLPPVRISGNQSLKGINYTLPVASAQVKSALLLAGLYASGEIRIVEPAPCRDHTERHANGVRLSGDSRRPYRHNAARRAPQSAVDPGARRFLFGGVFYRSAACIGATGPV